MQVIVKSPTQTIVYHANWLEIQTPVGGMVIMERHAPMIITLKPSSQLIMQVEEVREQVPVVQGVAHVTRDHVLVLTT